MAPSSSKYSGMPEIHPIVSAEDCGPVSRQISLSTALANGFAATPVSATSPSASPLGNLGPAANGNAAALSRRVALPSKVEIPKMAPIEEVATAAMQYLPTPLLVLSSFKTVMFANDAMGKLLGLDTMEDRRLDGADISSTSATDKLIGQSLSQIGIDLIQDGQPVWVNWEKMLDDLCEPLSRDTGRSRSHPFTASEPRLRSPDPSDLTRPVMTGNLSARGNPANGKSLVHDHVVEVVLSPQYIGSTVAERKEPIAAIQSSHVVADMVISTWKLEGQQYFSLAFSAQSSTSVPSSRSQTRVADRAPTSSTTTSPKSRSSFGGSPSHRCTHCGNVESFAVSPALTSPSDLPLSVAPLPLSRAAASPSVLQRTTRLKDAILNKMQTPKFAMWKDESIVVPNKAAEMLMQRHTDPASQESHDIFSRLPAYTEDFSRKLSPDENPMVVLTRTRKPFKSWKVGYLDVNGERVVYEVAGDCLYDPQTGEFIGGMTVLKDVTELTKIIRNQHEENEQRFELVCNIMPHMIWITTPEGDHEWFSSRWYEYTNMSVAKSLGKGWATPFHPDDMPHTSKKWAHSLKTGEEYSTEYRCRRHDGAWRWMLGRALPLRDQETAEILRWVGTCTDVHDQVEALAAQKQTHDQLLNVIDHAKVTVWTVDRKKNLTYLEGHSLRPLDSKETGFGFEDLINHPFTEVLDKMGDSGLAREYVKPVDRILAGKLGEVVSEYHSEGDDRWFRTRFVPILGNKRAGSTLDPESVDGVVGVSQDVTELKERELELHNTEKENLRLLSAETAAKEASRLKSQFLANMSHEIRTPIAGVIGMADLLIDTELDADQVELAENIQRSANGLLTVINDILDLSKVESGRLDIEEVQFSLSLVVRDVGKMMSFAAERKALLFEQDIQIGQEKDLIVLGDPGRCRQILTNLLTNSIKFTSEGSVKLSVWVKEETAAVTTVTFAVDDTGIGIEEEVRKKLFKPFSQADSSTARRFGGTGLGLTISKNLVDLMKGEITLDSILGTGTRASFTIPFNRSQDMHGSSQLVDLGFMPDRFSSELSLSARDSSDIGTPPQTPTPTGFPTSLPGGVTPAAAVARKAAGNASGYDLAALLPPSERKDIHVLVVEDNGINQQIAIRTVRKLGFSVSAVWNGKEALDYLVDSISSTSPQKQRADLILMDVQMPVLDGYHATHQIRHHDPYRSLPGIKAVPIIAMTASAIHGDREKCQRAGMDDYLAKPVKPALLERMLVKWAVRRKREAGNELTRTNSLGSISEHDSNCTDRDFGPPIHHLPKTLAAPSMSSSKRHSRTSGSSVGPSLPRATDIKSSVSRSGISRTASGSGAGSGASSTTTNDTRATPRPGELAAEKASALRDGKLMASGDSVEQTRSAKQTGSEMKRSMEGVGQLTVENVGLMNRRQEEANALESGGSAGSAGTHVVANSGSVYDGNSSVSAAQNCGGSMGGVAAALDLLQPAKETERIPELVPAPVPVPEEENSKADLNILYALTQGVNGGSTGSALSETKRLSPSREDSNMSEETVTSAD